MTGTPRVAVRVVLLAGGRKQQRLPDQLFGCNCRLIEAMNAVHIGVCGRFGANH
jgi:hypothetical protein